MTSPCVIVQPLLHGLGGWACFATWLDLTNCLPAARQNADEDSHSLIST